MLTNKQLYEIDRLFGRNMFSFLDDKDDDITVTVGELIAEIIDLRFKE